MYIVLRSELIERHGGERVDIESAGVEVVAAVLDVLPDAAHAVFDPRLGIEVSRQLGAQRKIHLR